MTRTVRPMTAADVGALVGLFDQAGLHPNVRPQDLEWKYWQPRADWPAARAFVMANDGTVQAAGALVPGRHASDAGELSLIHVIDWAALRGAIGAGSALMKHLAQQAQALLAVGGSAATRQILPHMGFKTVGAITGYVRSLHPWRLLNQVGSAGWRVLPRVARGLTWQLRAPAAACPWQARALAPSELAQVAAVLPAPARGTVVLERSVELFRYMLSCPIVPFALYAAEQSGHVRGYFMLAAAPGQVRLADLWVDSQEAADWRAVVLCAVGQAQADPQAAEIVTWASAPLLHAALRAAGFHARFSTPVQIRPSAGAALPAMPLNVHMLDNDAAYFHDGRREFWA
jgi:hypothetical protein